MADREQMADALGAHWFTIIQNATQTQKLENMLNKAVDEFIEESTFDELEEETLDLI